MDEVSQHQIFLTYLIMYLLSTVYGLYIIYRFQSVILVVVVVVIYVYSFYFLRVFTHISFRHLLSVWNL